ncbi:hypothetical protein H5410_031044 [Solanum commersonii]|uniref:CGL160/ATPI domain-containing protein n=1 Tax=Solanum commersonii TaxID=4109 RepID=A0A9J5YHA4_SOLCO|nr:hypothetical protein H5410_031044 [Solanum commersonii]
MVNWRNKIILPSRPIDNKGPWKVEEDELLKACEKLKDKLHFLALEIGGVGIVSAHVSYSPKIAASYDTGLLGSLMYMHMLGNNVNSTRIDGPKALI